MNYKKEYERWLNSPDTDPDTKKELRAISGNEADIKERFHRSLYFGTGGVRGKMGAGTNRINVHTIRRITQGLADFIKDKGYESPSVVIAYDTRRLSHSFAQETAYILNGNGVKAFIFDAPRPTPELSFAVRHLGCDFGVVITASHNTAEYNGYKLYQHDGSQVTEPLDIEVTEYVNEADFFAVSSMKTRTEELYVTIGKEIDDNYLESIRSIGFPCASVKNLSVVYSPLHGAAAHLVERLLSETGFTVHTVPEQRVTDFDFSTVKKPDPEYPEVFELSVALAKKTDADLILATDPDGDRVGVMYKSLAGGYCYLTANILASLLTEYILRVKSNEGSLPPNGMVISTIVASKLPKRICDSYGISYTEVLTGFKYIGRKIGELESSNEHEFIFGFEESCGYLANSVVRDKDAVSASLLICEMVNYYKNEGVNIEEVISALFRTYGEHREFSKSCDLKDASVSKAVMDKLRGRVSDIVSLFDVSEVRDYKTGIVTNIKTGAKTASGLPKSDVLYITDCSGGWVCVRPSGTEPKIKIYAGGEKINMAVVDYIEACFYECAL